MDPNFADLYRPQDFTNMFTDKPFTEEMMISERGKIRSVEAKGMASADESWNTNEEGKIENSFIGAGDEFGGEEIVLKCTDTLWDKLLDYGPTEDSWNIQLVNVEEFNKSLSGTTLTFIRAEINMLAKYRRFYGKINRFYTGLRKMKVGHLRINRVKRGNLAVLDLGNDRGFVRVCIEEDYDPFYHHIIVKLLDYNTLRLVDPTNLFYATDFFTTLPCQTNELALYGTGEYNLVAEFRAAIVDYVNENSTFFKAEVTKINKNNVAVVKLVHENFPEESANEAFLLRAVQKFKIEQFPPAGEIRSKAYVIHFESDCTIHVQFTSYVGELCRREVVDIPADKYEELKTQGPYDLNLDEVYLAMYADDFIYRAKIEDMTSERCIDDLVIVYFMDYGNLEYMRKTDLVPCRLISPRLACFPPQVVKARLINVNWIGSAHMAKLLRPDRVVSVETVIPAKENELPFVELFIQMRGELIQFTHNILAKSTSQCNFWYEDLMTAKSIREAKFHPFEIIDMKGIQWKNKYENPANIRDGLTIDIYIPQINTPEDFTIQPFGVQYDVYKIQEELTAFNSEFTGSDSWGKSAELSLLVDAAFCSLRLEDYDAFVRAKIANNPFVSSSPDEIQVLLVDYGRYVPALKENLRPLTLPACKLPAAGARGRLDTWDDAKFTDKKWTIDERLNFKNNVCGKRFLFNVIRMEYDNNECLCLTGDMFAHPGLSVLKTLQHVRCLPKLTVEELICEPGTYVKDGSRVGPQGPEAIIPWLAEY